MNKGKFPLNPKQKKQISKEIHKSLETPIQDSQEAEKMLKKYKLPRNEWANVRKNFEVKVKKNSSSHSKRTTPGEVNRRTTPNNAKQEGSRWHHNLERQTIASNKRLTKKIGKRNQLRRVA